MTTGARREVSVELAVDDVDAAELDRLAGDLRDELLRLDIGDVTGPAEREPPPGAPTPEVVALLPLIIAIGKTAGALGTVVHAVQGWVRRKPGRRVRMEIDGDVLELSSATADQQQQLVDAWLASHNDG